MNKKILKDLEEIDGLLSKIELKGESVIILASARMALKQVYEDLKQYIPLEKQANFIYEKAE